jgi:hypothetical protein
MIATVAAGAATAHARAELDKVSLQTAALILPTTRKVLSAAGRHSSKLLTIEVAKS